MSRTGKIDAGNPISSLNYLKKNIEILYKPSGQGFPDYEVDVVNFEIAKKACEKAKVEGHVECINQMKDLIHRLSLCTLPEGQQVIDSRVKQVLISNFNKLQDEILGKKI